MHCCALLVASLGAASIVVAIPVARVHPLARDISQPDVPFQDFASPGVATQGVAPSYQDPSNVPQDFPDQSLLQDPTLLAETYTVPHGQVDESWSGRDRQPATPGQYPKIPIPEGSHLNGNSGQPPNAKMPPIPAPNGLPPNNLVNGPSNAFQSVGDAINGVLNSIPPIPINPLGGWVQQNQ